MLQKIKKKFKKKNRNLSTLNLTPGETVRDALIQAGMKTAEEAGYAAGNTTDRLVSVASELGHVVDLGTQLGGGSESAAALGKIAFKTSRDIARGDTICTGLCVVSGVCETVALGCSTIKIIPFRGRIYVCVKIVSKGCMTYRNLCAGEGC